MYVCVCPAAPRWTHTSYHPEIWHTLLILPGLEAKLGGNPKCWLPGVSPIVTPSEIPSKVKNWEGASKQKLLLEVGLPGKNISHPNPGPQGPPHQKGVFVF